MPNCFYLVYKLKISHLLWIVNVTNDLSEIYSNFKYINSIHEKYYIIMKEVEDIDNELNFKRFTIFINDKNSHIISESN